MATKENVQQAILDHLAELVPHAKQEFHARIVKDLAEAYAWLKAPNNPHGGGVTQG